MFKTIILKVHNNRCNMKIGMSNEGHSLSMAIWLSTDCQWVFNEAFVMPRSHAVDHFRVRMGSFSEGWC